MDQQEKTKRYELGSFVACKRIAKVSHKCNCCAQTIHADVEYIEIMKQSRRAATHIVLDTVHLHYECFRSAMRMLRNAMEVLFVSNQIARAKEDDDGNGVI